jgi:ribosome-associated heat shock protein Hsp15
VDDRLQIKNESGEFHVDVLILSEIRGPAKVAQTLYRETEESHVARMKAAEERKAMPRTENFREGRPTKRDRRLIHRFRDEI